MSAERRADNQRRYLEARGAEVVEAPLLRTIDNAPDSACELAANELIADPPSIFIVQTGQGLDWWTERLSDQTRQAFLDCLAHVEIWSRGAKSTSRCRSMGLEVTWQCPSESAREIADRCSTLPPGTRVALQLVGTVGDIILDALNAGGADVIPMPVYRYVLPTDREPIHRLIEATIVGKIDAITFTASPAISHLRTIADEIGKRDQLDVAMQSRCRPVTVGPVCATTARDAGWQNVVEPATARLIPMLDALTEALAKPSAILRDEAPMPHVT